MFYITLEYIMEIISVQVYLGPFIVWSPALTKWPSNNIYNGKLGN